MAVIKTRYVCTNCAYSSPRWLGKCPSCNEWNTFSEEIAEKRKNGAPSGTLTLKNTPAPLKHIKYEANSRITTGVAEFDRTLGGGFVPGSVTLIGGEPGIGKSTLILQAAFSCGKRVLYVSGEESATQIKMRADRLNIDSEEIFLLAETSVNRVLDAAQELNPQMVIIDSIQTVYDETLENTPGTITQIRESAAKILEAAKRTGMIAVIIGHITKEGVIAGPKVLEHIVDTVIQFESELSGSYRIIRTLKNRFGNSGEIGVFEMHETGLTEVSNPSLIFLGERKEAVSGSVITATIEGSRALLVEVQALITNNYFGNPQRVTTGFDQKRLSILLAVIEKRAGFRLSDKNVFLNLTGGIRIFEPAVDLAVCLAIVSALLDKPFRHSVVFGEVGLGGEVRGVSQADKRIREAVKLGFDEVYLPSQNRKGEKDKHGGTSLKEVKDLRAFLESLKN